MDVSWPSWSSYVNKCSKVEILLDLVCLHSYLSVCLSVCLSVHPSVRLSMALESFVGPWPLFRVHNPIHRRSYSLDGGSARRKATTCLSVALQSLAAFQFLSIYTLDRTPCRYLHTQNNTDRINAHRYSCLEWYSNPRPQCSRGRRRFMS
jgi:hypothetical protein